MFTDYEWQAVCDVARLSLRERQVAELLLEGFARKVIARRLRKPDGEPLHVGSVDQFIQRLFHKLRVRSLVGLIPLFAVERLELPWIDQFPKFKASLLWFLKNRPDLVRDVVHECRQVGIELCRPVPAEVFLVETHRALQLIRSGR